MKRTIALLLMISLMLTLFAGCFGSSDEVKDPLTYHLPDVTAEMESAEYWTKDLKNGSKVLLSATEIAQVNNQIASSSINYTTDLVSYPSSLTVSQINGMLSTLKEDETELYTEDGSPIAEGFLDSLNESINKEALNSTTKVSYGILLTNDVLRTQPTATRVFADPKDKSQDLFQRGLVSIGEPVVVIFASSEQNWFFVKTSNSYGWLNASSVVFLEKGSWVNYINSKDFLVVTGSEITVDQYIDGATDASLTLRMGTKLPLYDLKELSGTTVNGQGIGSGYVVKIPVKNSLGYLEFVPMLIPTSADVSIGYLPYTSENIINQAFKLLGKRYCENGIYGGRDNASTVCDIMKTFGLTLPVTTNLQSSLTAKDTKLDGVTAEDRTKALEKTNPGSLLFTKEEALIYIGERDGHHYVIHPSKFFYFDGKRYDANSTVLSTLDIVKKDGTVYSDAVQLIKELAVVKSAKD